MNKIKNKISLYCMDRAHKHLKKEHIKRGFDWLKLSVYFMDDPDCLNYLKLGLTEHILKYCSKGTEEAN